MVHKADPGCTLRFAPGVQVNPTVAHTWFSPRVIAYHQGGLTDLEQCSSGGRRVVSVT